MNSELVKSVLAFDLDECKDVPHRCKTKRALMNFLSHAPLESLHYSDMVNSCSLADEVIQELYQLGFSFVQELISGEKFLQIVAQKESDKIFFSVMGHGSDSIQLVQVQYVAVRSELNYDLNDLNLEIYYRFLLYLSVKFRRLRGLLTMGAPTYDIKHLSENHWSHSLIQKTNIYG